RATSTRPATIVGSAKGRSITAFTSDLPRNRSRTSTHAISVPKTALTSATTAAITSVSFSAATPSGIETASQKPDAPSSRDAHTSAAIGSATISERKPVTKPRERADEAVSLAGTATETAALAASRTTHLLLDPDHQAGAQVEPALVRRPPAAEVPVGDPEDAGPGGVLRRELLRGRRVDGPPAGLTEQPLRDRPLREADELVRLLLVLAVLEDGDRQLDQHRLPRDHVLDVGTGRARGQRLALVREQDVAPAGQERVGRVAPGSVLRDDVAEELLDVGDRLLVRLPEAALRRVRGEDVPLRGAGAERVRRDHVDPGPDQVAPPLDVLRIAVPDGEDDHGVRLDPVVGLLVPAPVDETGVDERVHVEPGREEDDVRVQPRRHRLRLVPGGPVRLRERDPFALGRPLPGLDDLPHHRLRSRVGDDRQVRVAARSAGRSPDCQRHRQHSRSNSNSLHPHSLSIHFFYWSDGD